MPHREVVALVERAGLVIKKKVPLGSFPFTDRHMLRPVWLLEAAEQLASYLPATAALAQDVIYVCQRR